MRKYLGLVFGALILTGGAEAETADAQAGARIQAPLILTAWEELDFGAIAPDPAAAGTVTITPQVVRTCSAELTCLHGLFRAGKFSVTGEADAAYTITLPTDTQLTGPGGATMLIDAFTGSQATGVLVAGYDEFMVGGQLHVAAGQTAGDYTGQFTVTVEYN